MFKLYDCSVPNPQRKPEGPTPNRRRSSRSPAEGKPSRRAFNIEFCCLLVMAAAKDGALNQGAEDGLRVGDAASVEEVERYIFREVAASYVKNLTIPGS